MSKYLVLVALIMFGCKASQPTARIHFTAPDTYPEGIVYDPGSDVFYVSSTRTGTIGRVNRLTGTYSELYVDSTLRSTYGLKIHPNGKHLYACVSDANYSKYSAPEDKGKTGRLIAIDIATGKKILDVDLAALLPGKHFCNDLTFDEKGNAYITDSYAKAIYKVDANGNASLFSQAPALQTEGVGPNGIAYHKGGYLLVAVASKGSIYKINLAQPNTAEKVKLDQFLMGADGILLKGNDKLIVVANGGINKIFELTSNDDWKSAKITAATQASAQFSYPSTATFVVDSIWVMNASFHELADSNGTPSKTFSIQNAVLMPK